MSTAATCPSATRSVQPLTVKVLPPLSVRLAVVNPLKVSVVPAGHRQRRVGQVDAARRTVPPESRRMPLSVPPPVQPVTVKVLPPAGVGEVGGCESAQAERHAVGGGERRVGESETGALARRDRVAVAALSVSDPLRSSR